LNKEWSNVRIRGPAFSSLELREETPYAIWAIQRFGFCRPGVQ